MEDYPRNLAEFEARFATEEACRDYLFQLRWPEGFRCPRCGHGAAWPVRQGLWECSGCGRQTSVTAGTVFQDTRQPLRLWLRAIWWVTNQKNGVSALGLQRVLGLGSYKTAWSWLHKLRRAMVRPGRDRLSGRVEVDETYWGSPEEGVRGRQTYTKSLIAIAAQEDGRGTGRLRMRRVRDASAESLMPFVEEAIERGSTVHTDGWLGYEPLQKRGYRHEVTFLDEGPESASKLLPRVHRVASLLKRWLLGTHQGAVNPEHLDYYLDEFTFRFIDATLAAEGSSSIDLCNRPPLPYKSIIGGTCCFCRPQDVLSQVNYSKINGVYISVGEMSNYLGSTITVVLSQEGSELYAEETNAVELSQHSENYIPFITPPFVSGKVSISLNSKSTKSSAYIAVPKTSISNLTSYFFALNSSKP